MSRALCRRSRARLIPVRPRRPRRGRGPGVIARQLTAIGAVGLRRFGRDLAPASLLRTGARAVCCRPGGPPGGGGWRAGGGGLRRVRARRRGGEGRGGPARPGARGGDAPDPGRLRHLAEAVLGARWTGGIVLRPGACCRPGTSFTPGGAQSGLVRGRKFPLPGDGGGAGSFIRVAGAAAAAGPGGRGALRRGRR